MEKRFRAVLFVVRALVYYICWGVCVSYVARCVCTRECCIHVIFVNASRRPHHRIEKVRDRRRRLSVRHKLASGQVFPAEPQQTQRRTRRHIYIHRMPSGCVCVCVCVHIFYDVPRLLICDCVGLYCICVGLNRRELYEGNGCVSHSFLVMLSWRCVMRSKYDFGYIRSAIRPHNYICFGRVFRRRARVECPWSRIKVRRVKFFLKFEDNKDERNTFCNLCVF